MNRFVRVSTLASVLLALLCGTGCQHTFEEKPLGKQAPPGLGATNRIYIGRPFDASFKEKIAHNSGAQIAEALLVAFYRNTKFAGMSRRPQTMVDAMKSAEEWRADYLVYPTIVKWEDRATEFSGVRDKLEFRLDLYKVATGEVLLSHLVDAKSRWMTDGGDTPVDLLQAPIDQWVQSLFQSPIEKPNL